MSKRGIAFLAFSLVIASTLAPSVNAEEMTVESNKVYTPGTSNGVSGYWVEFSRKRYSRNENFIANPVGRYDATIQEVLGNTGLNRALSPSEMSAIYSRYGIPLASSASRDASLHDFNWDAVLNQIKADAAAGSLRYSNVSANDVSLMSKLLDSANTGALVDSVGGSALNSYIEEAFANNGGGEYTYSGGSGHTLSYHHGIAYENASQVDQAAYSQYANASIQSILLNDPAAYKKLTGMGNLDSYSQAGRLTMVADLIDKGVNPVGLKIDTWVNSTNGPVHIVESQPTAARLRDLSRWLVASTWTTHSPIALDLNHDGKIGVTGPSTAQKRLHKFAFEPKGAVWFDILANGKKQHIEWLNGDGDGFLVDDTNGRVSKAAHDSGVITASALFGDAIGYANGYHKLAYKATKINLASTLTMNDSTSWSALYRKNGLLKGKNLDTLKVWVDANHDALVQPTELYSLASLGVTEIGSRPVIKKNVNGEYVIQSYFVQHGKRYMTEDVWFAEDPATQEKK